MASSQIKKRKNKLNNATGKKSNWSIPKKSLNNKKNDAIKYNYDFIKTLWLVTKLIWLQKTYLLEIYK